MIPKLKWNARLLLYLMATAGFGVMLGIFIELNNLGVAMLATFGMCFFGSWSYLEGME